MALSDTALVTLAQAKNYVRVDSASSLFVPAEYVGLGDGGTVAFDLDNTPVSGSLQVYVNSVLQVEPTNYSISTATITFTVAPTLNHPITASYDTVASDNTFEAYDDTLLENLINAATKKAEDYTGRVFIQRTITEYHYGDGSEWLRLEYTPVVSITSVTLDTTLLTVDSDYTTYNQIGRLKRYAWDNEELVTVVHVSGYGATRALAQAAVPDAVMAVLSAVAVWYENRLGITSETVTGVGSVDYGATGELPITAKNYLSSIRRNLI